MNKYERLQNDLETQGWGKMKCFGNSMLPKLDNPTMNTYITQDSYEVGDIVFCKVRGYIDSHLITQKNEQRGYMISNNHGHQNGWSKKATPCPRAICWPKLKPTKPPWNSKRWTKG